MNAKKQMAIPLTLLCSMGTLALLYVLPALIDALSVIIKTENYPEFGIIQENRLGDIALTSFCILLNCCAIYVGIKQTLLFWSWRREKPAAQA